jgi:hypothetical protein
MGNAGRRRTHIPKGEVNDAEVVALAAKRTQEEDQSF